MGMGLSFRSIEESEQRSFNGSSILPMTLEIGDAEKIQNPTGEQIRHYLKFMPPAAPFVILSADESRFMQAVAIADEYRVEYRDEQGQWWAQVPYEQAAALFEQYGAGDNGFRSAVAWRRMNAVELGSNKVVIAMLALIILAIAAYVTVVMLEN
jgi:hypothetical protein